MEASINETANSLVNDHGTMAVLLAIAEVMRSKADYLFRDGDKDNIARSWRIAAGNVERLAVSERIKQLR